jgi:transposase InsO family protein
MSREAHVRFRESAAVRSRRATRPPAESFFNTLKAELCGHRAFWSRQEARTEIFEYIEVFYNRVRLHSSLGYRSPAEYERQNDLGAA